MKRILLVSHSFYNRAGVEEHIRTLAKVLSDQYDIHFIFPHQDSIVHRDSKGEVARYHAQSLSILSPQRHPPSEAALLQVIELVKPDLIHVVHFLGWPLNLFALIVSSGLPSVISFHDYFAITPIYTLEGQDVNDTLSAEYAQKYFGKDISSYLVARRQLLSVAFSRFKARVVPSQYLADTLAEVFPVPLEVIPYGIEDREIPPVLPSNKLRFGYMGGLLPQKGWELLHQAFQMLEGTYAEIELHFYGGDRPEGIPSHERIFFHGVYEQSQIEGIASRFDIGIIPSRFPETYSIVLSELWQAKKPVLVAEIGALAERVTDLKNGRTFIADDVTDLAHKLEWFINNQSWKAWAANSPVRAAEMGGLYRQVYEKLI